MKTYNFIVAVITFVMVSVSANAKHTNRHKVSSAFPESVEVVNSDSHAVIHSEKNGISYKYDFILDVNGRVVNRITSAWNSDNNQWIPLSAYSIEYTNEETILNYAKYNSLTKSYSKDVQQARYNASDFPVIFKLPKCYR